MNGDDGNDNAVVVVVVVAAAAADDDDVVHCLLSFFCTVWIIQPDPRYNTVSLLRLSSRCSASASYS